MMKRRKFLGFLAASPLAAKQAAEKAAAGLANVDVTGLDKGGLVGGSPAAGGGFEVGAIRRLLATTGIPDWKIEEMRDSARYVTHLDSDIASLRSASLSAKVAFQRRRNFERYRAQFVRNWLSPPSWIDKATEFRSKHGWPF